MQLEFNFFIFWACKWDIVLLKDDEYQINLKVYEVNKCKKIEYDEIHMQKQSSKKENEL